MKATVCDRCGEVNSVDSYSVKMEKMGFFGFICKTEYDLCYDCAKWFKNEIKKGKDTTISNTE